MTLAVLLCFASATADAIFENGVIWTPDRPGFASTMVIQGGKVVYLGDGPGDWTVDAEHRIDLKGKTILPGLIDSHMHLMGGGTYINQLDLRDASSKQDFVARIKAWCAKLEKGKWVQGGRWSVESWTERESPRKEWIESFTREIPVWLVRMDGHSGFANSAALKLAGITSDGPADPAGGVIDRDPVTKEPTGILRENAMGLVTAHIPAPSREEKIAGLRDAINLTLSMGVTSASEIASLADLPLYSEVLGNDKKFRMSLYPVTVFGAGALETAIKKFECDPDWAAIRGFKTYMDGSLGSRTAWMHEPFLGNAPEKPDWKGMPMPGVTSGLLKNNIAIAAKNGWQVIAHAIGDEANDALLNMLSENYPGLAHARCRSEHAQHMLPSDIARFGLLGVICSMQPYHKADDGRYAESYIGPDRAKSSYAYRSLLNAGAIVAFGSDWPVVTQNPFLGIEAAVTGRTLDGKIWQPQENISVVDALRCYTLNGAYAMKMDGKIGALSPGHFADFIVLNSSVFGSSVDWGSIKPVEVWVGGRRVMMQATLMAPKFGEPLGGAITPAQRKVVMQQPDGNLLFPTDVGSLIGGSRTSGSVSLGRGDAIQWDFEISERGKFEIVVEGFSVGGSPMTVSVGTVSVSGSLARSAKPTNIGSFRLALGAQKLSLSGECVVTAVRLVRVGE